MDRTTTIQIGLLNETENVWLWERVEAKEGDAGDAGDAVDETVVRSSDLWIKGWKPTPKTANKVHEYYSGLSSPLLVGQFILFTSTCKNGGLKLDL